MVSLLKRIHRTQARRRGRERARRRLSAERLEARQLLCNNVSGVISENTAWADTTQPYCLVGNVTVAEGAELTVGPDVTVNAQGRQLNVEGTATADGVTFEGGGTVVAPEGGDLTLVNSTMSSHLWSFSDTVDFRSNTFTTSVPVTTSPNLVAKFEGRDNTFLPSVTVDVRGNVEGSVTWTPLFANYRLRTHVNVGTGAELTLQPGITVNLSGGNLNVSGTVSADDVTFGGGGTATALTGGELSIVNSTLGTLTSYQDGSRGEVSASDVNSPVWLFSDAVDFRSNTFTTSVPVTTSPNLVSKFEGRDNTFLPSATVDVRGDVEGSVTWTPLFANYRFRTHVNVGTGAELTLQPEITVNLWGGNLNVSGTVSADDVTFEGGGTATALTGGELTIVNSTVGSPTSYQDGSRGEVSASDVNSHVWLFSEAVDFRNNTFTISVPVTTSPNLVSKFEGRDNEFLPSATVDVRGNVEGSVTWTPLFASYRLRTHVNVGTSARLTLQPEITVNLWGGNLNVSGTVSADDVTFEGGGTATALTGGQLTIVNSTVGSPTSYQDGSRGELSASDVTSQVWLFSDAVEFRSNTFTASVPVTTSPNLVSKFEDRDNQFLPSATVDVRGNVEGSVTWTPLFAGYRLRTHVNVGTGAELTLQPEITVNLWGGNLNVSGTVSADDVTFEGGGTATALTGSQLSIVNSTVGSPTSYQDGSRGELSSSDVNSQVWLFSDAVEFQSNTFTTSIPVTTSPNLVSKFEDRNNQFLPSATVDVRGNVEGSVTWTPLFAFYRFRTHVNVGTGAQLTLQPGVTVNLWGGNLNIDSTLAADGVTFEGGGIVNALDGGDLTIVNSTVNSHVSLFSDTVDFRGNRFTRSIPVTTSPNLVSRFEDRNNQFLPSATVDVRGNVEGSVTWTPLFATYRFRTHVNVGTGAQLTLQPGVTVNLWGGNLNVSGTVTADDVTFEGGGIVNALDGGDLTIVNSTVNSHMSLFSDTVEFRGNTFTRSIPVTTSPNLVAKLEDRNNQFLPSATVDVRGNVDGSVTWTPLFASYRLRTHVNVGTGSQLTLRPGVTVNLWGGNLNIDGTLTADGVTFEGGGIVNAVDGGDLTIVNSTVNSHVSLFSDTVDFRGNTFTRSVPITTSPNLVAKLEDRDNQFVPSATVDVRGNVEGSVTWTPLFATYRLRTHVNVATGAQLTLQPGVTVNLWAGNLSVSGVADANAATFTGGGSLVALAGGTVNIVGVLLGTHLSINDGSHAMVRSSALSGSVDLHSGAAMQIKDNDFFAAVIVRASGDPDTTIDLTKNYWGTTDPLAIERKIVHQADDADRPVVLFKPWLLPKQVRRLSLFTYDGDGDDITLALRNVGRNESVEVFAGPTLSNLPTLGIWTNTEGASPWVLSVDIGAAGLDRAEYIAITSPEPVEIIAAAGIHVDPAALEEHEPVTPAEREEPPALQRDSYDDVAKLYHWSTDQFVSITDAELTDRLAGRQNILLTHGWNGFVCTVDRPCSDDDLNRDFITQFAIDFGLGRSAEQLDLYNIFAIDWTGISGNDLTLGPLGSNPNGLPLEFDLPQGRGLPDVQRSAFNSIQAAKPLAERLAEIEFDPATAALIGHGTGAGFMASLSLELSILRDQLTSQLVSLDAVWGTSSHQFAGLASASTEEVVNYYLPPSDCADGRLCVPVVAETLFTDDVGFGAAMLSADNITNFELDGARTEVATEDLVELNAHERLAVRFADTSDNLNDGRQWGFQTNSFLTGVTRDETTGVWQEQADGSFQDLDLQLDGDLVRDIISIESGIDELISGNRDPISLWDASVLQNTLNEAVRGINVLVFDPFDPSQTPLLYGRSQSPVTGSVDVVIPNDTAFLSFEINVEEADLLDEFFISINDVVHELFDLVTLISSGLEVRIPVGQWQHVPGTAERAVKLNFQVPDHNAVNAELVLGQLNLIVDENDPPDGAELISAPLEENTAGQEVGRLIASDSDVGDFHAFEVVNDPRFEVVDNILRLRSDQSLDFETEPSVEVVVKVTDSDGVEALQTFTIDVLDQEDGAPTTVEVIGQDLMIMDVAGKADRLSVRLTGDAVIIQDPVNVIEMPVRVLEDDAHTVTIPLSAFPGRVVVDVGAGQDELTIEISPISTRTMVVITDAEDTVHLESDWRVAGGTVIDDSYYRVLEKEEATLMLNGPRNWQNPVAPHDVDGDGFGATLRDIVRVINKINRGEGGRLPEPTDIESLPMFVDVNGDGRLTLLDVHALVTHRRSLDFGAAAAAAAPTDDLDARNLGALARPNLFDRDAPDQTPSPHLERSGSTETPDRPEDRFQEAWRQGGDVTPQQHEPTFPRDEHVLATDALLEDWWED